MYKVKMFVIFISHHNLIPSADKETEVQKDCTSERQILDHFSQKTLLNGTFLKSVHRLIDQNSFTCFSRLSITRKKH